MYLASTPPYKVLNLPLYRSRTHKYPTNVTHSYLPSGCNALRDRYLYFNRVIPVFKTPVFIYLPSEYHALILTQRSSGTVQTDNVSFLHSTCCHGVVCPVCVDSRLKPGPRCKIRWYLSLQTQYENTVPIKCISKAKTSTLPVPSLRNLQDDTYPLHSVVL